MLANARLITQCDEFVCDAQRGASRTCREPRPMKQRRQLKKNERVIAECARRPTATCSERLPSSRDRKRCRGFGSHPCRQGRSTVKHTPHQLDVGKPCSSSPRHRGYFRRVQGRSRVPDIAHSTSLMLFPLVAQQCIRYDERTWATQTAAWSASNECEATIAENFPNRRRSRHASDETHASERAVFRFDDEE
jgi:hypothetical protein